MKTFIQLKDGIGFAFIDTPTDTDGIEVPFGTGESYLKKELIDNEWVDAPIIRYASLSPDGRIVEILSTVFSSVVGENPIIPEGLDLLSTWDGTSWVAPIDLNDE
jgi:hypothetical protein